MGKNYYCDYCDKHLKNDVQVIKKHVVGVAHSAARNEHYAKYKDPELILAEESQKNTCQRYLRNECKFGGNCRFSHYSPEEISNLQQEAQNNAYLRWYKQQPKTIDNESLRHFSSKLLQNDPEIRKISETWNYPDDLVKDIRYVPQSLRRIDAERIPKSFAEWG